MTQHIEVTPELYRQVFEVDRRGAACLEDLIKRFTQPAVTDGGIDAVLKTYERMGSARPAQYIVAMINRANNVEPTDLEAQFSTTESKP
jgi:hypothetical protein